MTGGGAMPPEGGTDTRRDPTFIRSDLTVAAEEFVREALDSLGLIWEPEEVGQEADALVDRAFGWSREADRVS